MIRNVAPIHFDRFISVYSKYLKTDLIAAFSDFEKSYAKYYGNTEDDLSDSFIYLFIETLFGKSLIPELKASGQFYATTNTLYHSYHFNKQKKVYKFDPDITTKLIYTNLSKVDTFFLKSPFRSIYISIPHNTFLKVTSHDGSVHEVEGFYVFYHDLETSNIEIPTNIPSGVKKFLRIMAIGKPNGTKNVFGLEDDCVYYLTFFFEDGDVFKEFEKGLFRVPENDREQTRQNFSFVINALLYLTSSNAELDFYQTQLEDITKLKNLAKIRKAEQRNSRISSCPYYRVGKSILIGPSEFYIPGYRADNSGPQRPFASQWLVSGHWRNQPYGPKLSERKLLWIEPYLKGEELGEIINKDYVVR